MADDKVTPRTTPDSDRIEELPITQVSADDAQAVKGGATEKTTEGVKKTMQTQV